MGTSELKLNLHKLIDGISDNSVLQSIYTLLAKSTDADWYDGLSNEAKASIKKGLKDVEQSNFIPFDEVQSKVDAILGR